MELLQLLDSVVVMLYRNVVGGFQGFGAMRRKGPCCVEYRSRPSVGSSEVPRRCLIKLTHCDDPYSTGDAATAFESSLVWWVMETLL